MTALFDLKKLPYHWLKLKCENPLNIVIKGIDRGMACDVVKEDLKTQGITASKVSRMTQRQKPLVVETKAASTILRRCATWRSAANR
jgi:hypothetical protein